MEQQKKQTWENKEVKPIATMLTRMRMVEGLTVERIAKGAEISIEKYLLFEDLLGGMTAAEVHRVESVIYNHTESRLRGLKSRRKYLMGLRGQFLHHIKLRWYQFWFSDSQLAYFAKFLLFADFFMVIYLSTVVNIPLVDSFFRGLARVVIFMVRNLHFVIPISALILTIVIRKIELENRDEG